MSADLRTLPRRTFDESRRRFTLNQPVHVDLFGGVVKIICTNAPSTGCFNQPILALRYDASGEISEEHYSLEGGWDHEGKPSRFDLWDADLASVRPLASVEKPKSDEPF